MSIQSDFDWLNINIVTINDDNFNNILELAYKRMIIKTHPDRKNIEDYNKTVSAYHNILDFISKRKNVYRRVKQDDLKNGVHCRCGTVFVNIEGEIFIDCMCCSCFIEIIN